MVVVGLGAKGDEVTALVEDDIYLASSQLATVKAHYNIELPTTLTFSI